ncbi:epoxide hydrolase [Rhypophila decipiens]|uniref:Epoxide hydrolase n=1 Tax=Rhypophila decipiens TaxID=261697 RepID=A0AAN7BCW5_9PEZI|nr:epoxide hydrolase [Rhypophila decipiens]
MADPGTGTGTGTALTAGVDEAVKPYKIHIPNKYLEQVKRKLELTRLPHEGSEPKSNDWWEPKPIVEPLIDFWLDKYNWKDQEKVLNDTLSQYRTSINLPPLTTPLRLHFIHVRSSHEQAVPLLLIPPFPFTNLSFGHLVKPLTEPEDAVNNQPFHLVIPSLPGLGFSDALPNNLAPIPATAEVFNSLMARLGYQKYLASGATPGHLSPAEIDWKLINCLATKYSSSCIGAHFISPPLSPPTFNDNPMEYMKWTIAEFFHAEILGYTVEDFQALDRIHRRPGARSNPSHSSGTGGHGGNDHDRLRDSNEPNTLAYALCDSPTGMLAFVLKALRKMGPNENSTFAQEQLITLTNLAWLPGPEYAMRFWAHCATHDEAQYTNEGKGTRKMAVTRPKVAITVFTGAEDWTTTMMTSSGAGDVDMASLTPRSDKLTRRAPAERYTCPAWANGRYNVIHTQRASGKGGGLLAFERPDIIIGGIRGLAKSVLSSSGEPFKADPGPALTETGSEGGGEGVAPLESVVVVPSSATTAAPTKTTATPIPTTIPAAGKEKEIDFSPSPVPLRPAASPPPSQATSIPGMGLLSPPSLPRDHSFGSGSSPDTLVEGGKKSPMPSPGDNATLVSGTPSPSPARSPAGTTPS